MAEELRETVDPEIPEIKNVICRIGRTAVTHRGLMVPIEHQLLELGAEGFELWWCLPWGCSTRRTWSGYSRDRCRAPTSSRRAGKRPSWPGQARDSVVVYGGGPVGLLAAYSATLKSAAKVVLVDRQPDRLKLAESIGVIAIDDFKGSPVDQILEQTGGEGADCGCEAVGYQAHDHHGDEVPNLTMNNLVASVKATGGIGIVGVFVPEDPGAQDELAKQGQIAFDFGSFWFKGQRMATARPTSRPITVSFVT